MEETQEAVETPAEAPTQAEESAPSVTEAPEVKETQGEEQLSPKTQARMQKLANEAREAKKLRAEAQQLKQQLSGLSEAQKLDRWLRQSPANLKKFMDLMDGKNEPENDPYAEFAPEVAERFRKLDALEQWKADQEARQKQQEAQTVEGNKKALEKEYISYLEKDGFVKDGKSVDPQIVDMIDRATLATVMEIAENPNFPTREELRTAYDQVIKGIEAAKKFGVRSVVKQPGVPATGSKTGTMPSKGPETDQQRVDRILSELGG